MRELRKQILILLCLTSCATKVSNSEVHSIIDKYDDGSIKTELFITTGTKVNPTNYKAIGYYQGGQKEITFFVENNLRQGISEYWYPNGQIKYRVNYVADSLSGESIFYYESGNVKQRAFYKSGKLTGESIDYYNDGKVLSKGNFKDGEGFITYFNASGTKQKEGLIKDNQENGKWLYYHENGKLLSEGTFKNGVKNGPYKVYDNTGEIIEQGVYKDGKAVQN